MSTNMYIRTRSSESIPPRASITKKQTGGNQPCPSEPFNRRFDPVEFLCNEPNVHRQRCRVSLGLEARPSMLVSQACMSTKHVPRDALLHLVVDGPALIKFASPKSPRCSACLSQHKSVSKLRNHISDWKTLVGGGFTGH